MKHYIFDIDGTLIDSETPLLLSWQKTLKDYGYEAPLDNIRKLMGMPIMKIVEKTGIDAPDNIDEIWQQNYALFADSVDYFPKMKEVIQTLHEHPEIQLGIVSSRAKSEIESFFDKFHFATFFQTIVLSDDTILHKPNPEPILKYIELANANPSDCIYFGDTNGDMECAKSAGIKACLCTWKGANISSNHADYTLNDIEALLSFYF